MFMLTSTHIRFIKRKHKFRKQFFFSLRSTRTRTRQGATTLFPAFSSTPISTASSTTLVRACEWKKKTLSPFIYIIQKTCCSERCFDADFVKKNMLKKKVNWSIKETADEEKRQPLDDGKPNNVIEKEALEIMCVCLLAEFLFLHIKTVFVSYAFHFVSVCGNV